MDLFERFAALVRITETCWLWEGTTTRDGYGHFDFEGKTYIAHRVSHELFKGPIPPGFPIDHLCRTHNCVGPFHIEAVTNRENIRRGLKGLTGPGWLSECPHGASARRKCNQCHAERMRRFRANKRAA